MLEVLPVTMLALEVRLRAVFICTMKFRSSG